MNSLYLENSTMGSLFRFFSRYFSTATRPTQFLLTWLVIAQLALQSFPSLRFLHRNFLSSVTHRCLNSYYRALRNETVTSRSLRLQTAALACSLIPAALQNEPVFLSVDDTTVPKFGKKFDAVSLLHDHACHTGKPYVNGHCFVSLTLSVPVLSPREGKAPLIRYLAIPVGYRMWTKERTKLELAGDLVEEMMPLLKGRQVLLFFDSWYAKSSLMERVLQYPQLAIVCNVRSDSAMYELPPLPNGKPGRPKKRGKRIHLDDFTLSWEMDGMRIWPSAGAAPYLRESPYSCLCKLHRIGITTTFLQHAGSQRPAYELRLTGTKNIVGCAGRWHGILPIEAVQTALGHRDQLL